MNTDQSSQPTLFDSTADVGVASEWSEANLCLCWVTQSDGRHWRDWWAALPTWQRNSMLLSYRCEREQADAFQRGRMRSYESIMAIAEEGAATEERMAQKWAEEIRQAAVERRPLPFFPCEEGTPGFRLGKFESRLARAFQIAGVVIVESAKEPEPAPRKKKAAA